MVFLKPADHLPDAMCSSRVLWISASNGLPAGWAGRSALWNAELRLPAGARSALAKGGHAAVVLDVAVSEGTVWDLYEDVRQAAPNIPVLIHDPHASLSDAVRLSRAGVHQFLTSPEEGVGLIDDAVEHFRNLDRAPEEGPGSDWERLLVGTSEPMRAIQRTIRLVASRRATVLVTGETGTGKELAARALHLAGSRRSGPWVAVNCSALPEALMESELFGHVRGAFTGAFQARTGRFEQADGGTLFLDEIGELPLDLQTKLLRVLQERELQRLGSSETIRVDVRVVAATNRDLAARVAQGRFREDLYYRLNVVPIEMPPLRRRLSDVPVLAAHFMEKVCRAEDIPRKTLAREAVARLASQPWPGNVRQLENVVEMAVALSGDRIELVGSDFSLPVDPVRMEAPATAPVVAVPDCGLDYEQTLAVIERSILEQALKMTGGNKKAAAEMLRLKRTTLSAKVRSLEAVA